MTNSTDAAIHTVSGGDVKERGKKKKVPEEVPGPVEPASAESTVTSPTPGPGEEEEGHGESPFPGFPSLENFDPSFFLNALSSLAEGGAGRPKKKRRPRLQGEDAEDADNEDNDDDDDDNDDDGDYDDDDDDDAPLEAFLTHDGETLASIAHRQAAALENIAESFAKFNKIVWKFIQSR